MKITLLFFITFFSFCLNEKELIHFLNKTCFSDLSYSFASKFSNLNRKEVVDLILKEKERETPYPAWYGEKLTKEKFKNLKKQRKKLELETKEYWLKEILSSDTPFYENMTLFWHSHFATSMRKVKHPHLMIKQNLFLRENCLGNFGNLVHGISNDPAMAIYLDLKSNRKKNPNENYARELMELYTLGEGNGYNENDIKEIARAFTGFKINPYKQKVFINFRQFDNSKKIVFGKEGNFNHQQIVDLILKKEEVSFFITKKLWEHFISLPLKESRLKKLSQEFRNSDLNIKELVRNILLSDEFWHPDNYSSKIKSPVELIVGIIRSTKMQKGKKSFQNKVLVHQLKILGQNLFAPPNVNGWTGDWIDTSTLEKRDNIIGQVKKKLKNIDINSYYPEQYNSFVSYLSNLDYQLK